MSWLLLVVLVGYGGWTLSRSLPGEPAKPHPWRTSAEFPDLPPVPLPLPTDLGPDRFRERTRSEAGMFAPTRDRAVAEVWPGLQRYGLQPGATVVDLGCGGGFWTFRMSRVADRVYAVDIDPAATWYVEELARRAGAPNVVAVTNRPADLPLRDGEAHLVWMAGVHWLNYGERTPGVVDRLWREGRGALLTDILRCLRPGGHLVIHEASLHANPEAGLTQDQFVDLVERAGLRCVERRLLGPKESSHDWLVFQRPP